MASPGRTKRSGAHVHESPWIMIGPLFVLAIGAVVAGAIGYHGFVGGGYAEFWGDSLKVLPTHTAPFVSGKRSPLGQIGAACHGGRRYRLAYRMYIQNPGMADRWRAFHEAFTSSASTNGTSTNCSTVFSSVRRSVRSLFWKKGDGAIIDGFGPDGIAAAAGVLVANELAADRLCLSLRFRHVDRRCCADYLVYGCRGGGVSIDGQ